MELAVFIQKQSDKVVAQLLDVPLRTVASWRRLERAPRPQQALNIISKTEGLVSWQGIYQPYARYQSRLQARQQRYLERSQLHAEQA
ncbi:hypothetical protein ACWJJH_02795 [Endozoicomonadaceae bacterium StTr2]